MCGRYTIFGRRALTQEEMRDAELSDRRPPRAVERELRWTVEFMGVGIDMVPNFDASPTQMLPIYREVPDLDALAPARWGLVPFWWRGKASELHHTFNARAETVDTSKAYRDPFRRRRCLVPMNSFYEWQETPFGKVRHLVRVAGAEVFGCAGIWDEWTQPDGTQLRSFSIVTCPANELMTVVHYRRGKEPRMPVILAGADLSHWSDPDAGSEPAALKALLKPFPSEAMIACPVRSRADQHADLLEPIGPPVRPA